jgi:hypothetical protein
MKRRFSWKRAVGIVVVGGLVMVLAGDHGRASTTATPGIDPLEVLGLQIKPNVILVLDTSGSMNDTVGNNTIGGDHPDSKIGAAKRVLLQAIQNNESKVNFMFGTYTQSTSASPVQTPSTLGNTGTGNDRFSYWAKSSDSPSMLTTELFLNQVYAFQTISNAGSILDNILYFDEGGATFACAITPGFYVSGAALATQMAANMNACTPGNGYGVTYAGGVFTFSRTGPRSFRLRWSQAVNSIRAVLNAGVADTALNTTAKTTGNANINALRKAAGDGKFVEAGTTFYEMNAGRFYNGQTLYVLNGTGTVCGQAATVTPTNPPTVNLQQVSNCLSPTTSLVGVPVPFVSAGGSAGVRGGGGWGSNAVSCDGFKPRVQLVPCDIQIPPAPLQSTNIGTPFLQPSLRIDTTAGPTFGQPIGYTELNDGTGTVVGTPASYGLPADGSTPIANTVRDIKTVFNVLWGTGGQPPAPLGPVVIPPSGAIQTHASPKEKTVVVFVTDGDDTCSGSGDPAALAAASRTQALYQPIVGGVQTPSGYLTTVSDPASSVITYIVGYGTGAQVSRLNWIAWGGSGMQQVTPAQAGGTAWPAAPTAAARALCVTCQDAFLAPTPAALAATLNAIFNQGAQSGEFTAQQSVTDAIYEYVDKVPAPMTSPVTPPFSAFAPYNRYDALTPIKYVSSFTLPGFNGQLKAYRNVAGAAVLQWSAGDKLLINVTSGMSNATNCPLAANPSAVAGECNFTQLHGGATDSTIAGSTAAIKRRIYTTTQNGYFGVTVANLTSNAAPFRVPLWPPTSLNVAPADYITQGLLDAALSLPLDTSATLAADFTSLQTNYRACQGSNLPAGCISVSALTKMQTARREAREMILAFMAGALPSVDNAANPKRVTSGANLGAILYHAKSWILAEAALATPAVVGPPIESTPDGTPWVTEYNFYLKGERDASGPNAGKNTGSAAQIDSGFGLTDPDKDSPAVSGNDPRALKPVMTAVYAGANDMLHAFRAGPNVDTTATTCTYTGITPNNVPPVAGRECGGDELWGFVPFDSLGVLSSRYVNQPPKRLPHDYMIAASIRFNDIFVPNPGTASSSSPATPFTANMGGALVPNLNGVWRKVIYFGRGIGGKYFTALDITAPGTFQRQALQSNGPIPLWNRGNPDTNIGPRTGGLPNNTAADQVAYSHMGQTWSTPAVVFVDKTNNTTVRKPSGVDFVMYVGSGYGDTSGCPASSPCEGSTFYALDGLTGDVIKSVDVEATAATFGLSRSPKPLDQASPPQPYDNAIVADPVGFNPIRFVRLTSPHPSAAKTTRIYVADVYGRLWKFLTGIPDSPWPAIPAADLGVTQAVGTAASLIGLKPPPGQAPGPNAHIYVTSGNENRATGPFSVFAFRDDGDDTTAVTAGTAVFPAPASPPGPSVKTFLPVVALFTRTFDQGPVTNPTAPTPFPVFRGTAQPATAFTTDARAIAFFVGTRFNAPLTAFAPVPPPYPCRSSFDSIIYSVGARSGLAAYDLNATGDDAFSIYRDSRVVAITTEADPGQGSGSRLNKDEGLSASAPDPPPAPGRPQGLSSNVRPTVRSGHPFPAMKFGSTVCR